MIYMNYGREERKARWALAQRTLHVLQAPEPQISSTKRAGNCLKLQSRLRGKQKLQEVLPEAAPLTRTDPDEARPLASEFQTEVVRKPSKKVQFYNEMDINTFMKL
ncbi:hypothetical protein Tco_1094254 [Tanacetum coccineum]|uniref:Uncharacterized protein n=1 Tax=Tanacetum coccineum TaxID=301880 RepID=A0ABQ5IF07_9ASTR